MRPARATKEGQLVLDGELVAWKGSEPYFPPRVCRRVLNRDMTIQPRLVVFDLLRVDGEDMTGRSYLERRERLEALELHGPGWATSERFEGGCALYNAVCRLGFEGVVAKNHASLAALVSAAGLR